MSARRDESTRTKGSLAKQLLVHRAWTEFVAPEIERLIEVHRSLMEEGVAVEQYREHVGAIRALRAILKYPEQHSRALDKLATGEAK